MERGNTFLEFESDGLYFVWPHPDFIHLPSVLENSEFLVILFEKFSTHFELFSSPLYQLDPIPFLWNICHTSNPLLLNFEKFYSSSSQGWKSEKLIIPELFLLDCLKSIFFNSNE